MVATNKLLVIVGPTASGKSALAIELAEKLGGELICADSRTVYKYLDIGTAKPSLDDQKSIPHHLLDVVNPNQNFTVADFKRLAEATIIDIHERSKLPIMVGGSGLYIDSVLFDYGFSSKGAKRDLLNPRHLSIDVPRKRHHMRDHTLVVGLEIAKDALRERIIKRVEDMLHQGLVEEVTKLQASYPDSKALQAPGYKAFIEYINGRLNLDEAKALFIKNDFQLARRQMTWFRRNSSIHWLDYPNKYVESTTTLLNKIQ